MRAVTEIVASDNFVCQVGMGQVHACIDDGNDLVGGASGNISGLVSLDCVERIMFSRIGIVYTCIGCLVDVIGFN